MGTTLNLGAVTAYAIAVQHGFIGSEEEWLESLKGQDGVDGNGLILVTNDYEVVSSAVEDGMLPYYDAPRHEGDIVCLRWYYVGSGECTSTIIDAEGQEVKYTGNAHMFKSQNGLMTHYSYLYQIGESSTDVVWGYDDMGVGQYATDEEIAILLAESTKLNIYNDNGDILIDDNGKFMWNLKS